MKILFIDYQEKGFVYCDDETEYLQNVKKAIQFMQNIKQNRDIERKYKKRYSMVILTLASYLKRNGMDVCYLSMPQDEELFREMIKGVDVVYFWSDTAMYPKIAAMIKEVKENYHVITILGGYHALGLPDMILRELSEVDYVSIGESERSLLHLLEGRELKKIQGIAYRDGDRIVIQRNPEQLEDDQIPEPDYSILHGDRRKYRFALQSTRSCPHRCRYCVYGYYGGKVRIKSIESLRKELIQIKKICGVKLEMHMLDNVIAYDVDSIKQLTNLLNELDMEINFSGDIRAEYLQDIERIEAMERLGVKQLFLGFEDAEDVCRQNAARFVDEEMLLKGLKMLKQHSCIIAECYWMMGMPGTTVESFDKNINLAVRLIEERLIESICTDTIYVPSPGTPMFDYAEDFGIHIVETDWRFYQRSNYMPVFSLDTITRQEVRDGLVRFDRSVIDAQLKILGVSEEYVLKVYMDWLRIQRQI